MRHPPKDTILPAVRTINGGPAPSENVDAAVMPAGHQQTSSDGSTRERSDLMNLINASANYLFSTMSAQPKNDVDSVKNICVCAKQIKELLRLKLDVIKIKSGY